jgi:hypothetical protein
MNETDEYAGKKKHQQKSKTHYTLVLGSSRFGHSAKNVPRPTTPSASGPCTAALRRTALPPCIHSHQSDVRVTVFSDSVTVSRFDNRGWDYVLYSVVFLHHSAQVDFSPGLPSRS